MLVPQALHPHAISYDTHQPSKTSSLDPSAQKALSILPVQQTQAHAGLRACFYNVKLWLMSAPSVCTPSGPASTSGLESDTVKG